MWLRRSIRVATRAQIPIKLVRPFRSSGPKRHTHIPIHFLSGDFCRLGKTARLETLSAPTPIHFRKPLLAPGSLRALALVDGLASLVGYRRFRIDGDGPL